MGCWVPRAVLALVVSACLIVAFSSCAVIRTAAAGAGGGLVGFAVAGPAGAAAGAGIAAGASEFVNEKERADKDRDSARAELRLVNDQIVELRATLKANEKIDAFNLRLPAGSRRVEAVQPAEPLTPASTWFSRTWKALAIVLALGACLHFRRGILAGAKRLPAVLAFLRDFLRGRAPSAPRDPPVAPPVVQLPP